MRILVVSVLLNAYRRNLDTNIGHSEEIAGH